MTAVRLCPAGVVAEGDPRVRQVHLARRVVRDHGRHAWLGFGSGSDELVLGLGLGPVV